MLLETIRRKETSPPFHFGGHQQRLHTYAIVTAILSQTLEQYCFQNAGQRKVNASIALDLRMDPKLLSR